MARYFNTTGPCMPHLHYMLPPAARLIGASLDRYIRDQLYWGLHAPRQTGKKAGDMKPPGINTET